MRLFEEYLQRHNLSYNGPYHCWEGAIVLQTEPEKFSGKWLFVKIHWEPESHHPGTYELSFSRPLHNNDPILAKCFRTEKPVILQWDEYEDWIVNWAKTCLNVGGIEPLVRKTKRGWEFILSLWEVFAYCFDNWFCQQPFYIKEHLFNSLDTESSIKHRFENYQAILIYLSNHYQQIFKLWKTNFLDYFHNYSDWLVNLFEQK